MYKHNAGPLRDLLHHRMRTYAHVTPRCSYVWCGKPTAPASDLVLQIACLGLTWDAMCRRAPAAPGILWAELCSEPQP